MNPRQTNNKSTVPRFRAFFLARRREAVRQSLEIATSLFIRSERGPKRTSVPGSPQTGLRLWGGVLGVVSRKPALSEVEWGSASVSSQPLHLTP